MKNPLGTTIGKSRRDTIEVVPIENTGGEPIYKGKYDQQSFKHHNEMKILNSLQGKYKNDAQRREFEGMNEEALKEADKRAKAKAIIDVPINPGPGQS